MIDSDAEAWVAYPHHRDWFDKLRFSLRMGYRCGPCGTAPGVAGTYVVRPCYNLEGMGAGARVQHITAGDDRAVEPGYFWCELFTGPQLSVTYRWDGVWVPESSWCGELAPGDLTRFRKWTRSDEHPAAPAVCDELADVGHINVEFVGGRPIEVHLRLSPDPGWGDEIVPVWEGDTVPDGMVAAYDDAGGFIPVARLGFVVR